MWIYMAAIISVSLGHAEHEWTLIYSMKSCEMVSCFYSTVTSLLDQYLPLLSILT